MFADFLLCTDLLLGAVEDCWSKNDRKPHLNIGREQEN
jgi:hypothetical protein